MEQQTGVRTLVDRGDALLRDDKAAEAAAEFARAVQLDPNAVGGHLGLAEANLALGQFGIAQQAANFVRQIAPATADAALAEAILAVIAHNYDAALAEARAARLSGKRDWSALFPQVVSYGMPSAIPAPPPTSNVVPAPGRVPQPDNYTGTPHRIGYAQQRQWQGQPRSVVRLRLLFATQPIVTYTLIAVNVALWVIPQLLSFVGLGHISEAIYNFGVQDDALILHNPLQAYRFVTAMFLHDPNSILHIGLNMLSLYFVGVITERVFGAGRYTVIYFLSGIAGGLTQFAVDVLTHQLGGAYGASGAIFGIFGAFGAFILLRRRQLGPAANSLIGQWFFFLIINLVFSFGGFTIGGAGIAGFDHLGGLAAGLILGALMVQGAGVRRR